MQFKSPFSNEMKRRLSRPAVQDQIFQCSTKEYSEEVKALIAKIKIELIKLNETIYNITLIKNCIHEKDKDKFLKVKSNLLHIRSNLQRQAFSIFTKYKTKKTEKY